MKENKAIKSFRCLYALQISSPFTFPLEHCYFSNTHLLTQLLWNIKHAFTYSSTSDAYPQISVFITSFGFLYERTFCSEIIPDHTICIPNSWHVSFFFFFLLYCSCFITTCIYFYLYVCCLFPIRVITLRGLLLFFSLFSLFFFFFFGLLPYLLCLAHNGHSTNINWTDHTIPKMTFLYLKFF